MKSTFQGSKISLTNIHESILSQIPLWTIKKPVVILDLNNLPKTKTHPSTYQEKFHNILEHHSDHLYVFRHGSKDTDKTACVAVLNKTILKKSLPIENSFFTVEGGS